ncbi:MAG: murein biosynthesis integral membrane protein MurJ, partial [Spirochaetes bacterium]
MFCTLLSRLLGFIRVAVIGAIFGASGKADVLNTVFQIPNNLRKLLAEGALSSAFIPALSSLIVKNNSLDSAKKLTRNIITFLILILTPLIVLAIVFARPIINVLLPFPEKWKVELSINLFRWLIGYIGLISISSIIMAVLNSHGQFIIPALSPTLFSICVISSILFLYRYIGIYSVAAGVLSGGLAQIIFQSPLYLKKG